jgi:hypothetical protein
VLAVVVVPERALLDQVELVAVEMVVGLMLGLREL